LLIGKHYIKEEFGQAVLEMKPIIENLIGYGKYTMFSKELSVYISKMI